MDRQRESTELHEAMTEALAGARSLRLHGWVAEECEAAALERLARYWPDGNESSMSEHAPSAYLLGRRAAVDELRRLTRWRRTVHMREVPFASDDRGDRVDPSSTDGGFDAVESALDFTRSLARHRPRDQLIALALAGGYTGREVAVALRVSPSVVSVALRRVRQRLSWA